MYKDSSVSQLYHFVQNYLTPTSSSNSSMLERRKWDHLLSLKTKFEVIHCIYTHIHLSQLYQMTTLYIEKRRENIPFTLGSHTLSWMFYYWGRKGMWVLKTFTSLCHTVVILCNDCSSVKQECVIFINCTTKHMASKYVQEILGELEV